MSSRARNAALLASSALCLNSDHACVRVTLRAEEALAAAELRLGEVRADRVLRHEPVERRRRARNIVDVFQRARELVEDGIRRRERRLLVQQLAVGVDSLLRETAGGVRPFAVTRDRSLGVREAQVTEAPQGLRAQRRVGAFDLQERLVALRRLRGVGAHHRCAVDGRAALGEITQRRGLARLARGVGRRRERDRAADQQCQVPALHRAPPDAAPS